MRSNLCTSVRYLIGQDCCPCYEVGGSLAGLPEQAELLAELHSQVESLTGLCNNLWLGGIAGCIPWQGGAAG